MTGGDADFIGPLSPDSPWPRLERLRHAPFPCHGVDGPDGVFADARVLLHVTPGFDPSRPLLVILFLHGWRTTLCRQTGGSRYHVVESYRLVEQIDAAGLNAVLVAPQFARDADTEIVDIPGHPGKFGRHGGVARLLGEALRRVAALTGSEIGRYRRAPVLLVSFSGGYRAAAKALAIGGIGARLIGVIGLDTIYGEADVFTAWFAAHHRHAFLAAVYTGGRTHDYASAKTTLAVAAALTARQPGLDVRDTLPAVLEPGVAALVPVGDPDLHLELVAAGWPGFDQPVRRLLARLPGFARGGA